MPIESRSKLVSFRMTEKEYARFRDLCHAKGMGSVSEMTRAAIDLLLQHPDQAAKNSLQARVSELESRMEGLAIQVDKLHRNSK
jgi:Arc/MetJ-type ribon-helix-helix transcriptional regulator